MIEIVAYGNVCYEADGLRCHTIQSLEYLDMSSRWSRGWVERKTQHQTLEVKVSIFSAASDAYKIICLNRCSAFSSLL